MYICVPIYIQIYTGVLGPPAWKTRIQLPSQNPRESKRESTRIPGENPAIRVATARNPENPRPKSTSEMLASFTGGGFVAVL